MAAEEQDRTQIPMISNQSLKIFLAEGSEEDQARKVAVEITAARTSTLKISP
jgi:hypothetical protein